MSELRLEIPLIPPSGNHYKTYRIVAPRSRAQPFAQWYLTPEAEAWNEAVAAINGGRRLLGKDLVLSFVVYLRDRKSMPDLANCEKCIGDALQKCGAIENDRYINEQHQYRRFSAARAPLTVIVIRSDQEQMFTEGR